MRLTFPINVLLEINLMIELAIAKNKGFVAKNFRLVLNTYFLNLSCITSFVFEQNLNFTLCLESKKGKARKLKTYTVDEILHLFNFLRNDMWILNITVVSILNLICDPPTEFFIFNPICNFSLPTLEYCIKFIFLWHSSCIYVTTFLF